VSLDVVPVTAGSAHTALAEAVAAAKGGEVLRPVTVLVPTNAAGVIARRTLGRLGGVAAVDFITLSRLAERLAGPALRAEHRLPASTAVVDLAVRWVLGNTPTQFDAVAEHPSTVVALRDLYRELRLAGGQALDRLAQTSRRGHEVARICTLVGDRLAPTWYDEGDLLTHAVAAVRGGVDPALARAVLFLPQSLGPLELGLVHALGEQGSMRVLLGFTGNATADNDIAGIAAALSSHEVAAIAASRAAATEIVSVTDADEEVRHAVREVVEAARRGTPLARMAILWPTDRPYARLVEHHLGVAGIPWNGRPGTKVSERVVPRFLLDLLDVDRRGLRRRDLFNLLADVPVRDRAGRPLPVAAWERASRDAGVVKDEQWVPRLQSYAAWQRRAVADRHGDDEPAIETPTASPAADAAESLAMFVADLRDELGRPTARRTWSAWADWAVAQINDRLGPATLQHLDDAEFQAWEHTIRVLDRLRHLDSVGAPATRSEFRSVFAAEFDVAPGRLGRIGAGVTIGSLAGSVGLVAELAIVLGAADGLMPSPPSVDPLIADADRRAAGLATSDSVAGRMHRQLLGLFDSVPRVVVTTPRGDLRTATVRQPSRWLAAALGGVTPKTVASYASGLLRTPFPAHAGEHRLRRHSAEVLTSGPEWLASLSAPEGDVVLARSLTLRAARRSNRLTEFDGDLSAAGVPPLTRPVSPTQLQSWAACPHAYFVQYVLGVRAVEEPGDEIAITPIDKGNVLHAVLDRFHREVIAGQLSQPDQHGWAAVHRTRLVELFTETAARYEHSGRTGRAAYWEIDRQRLLNELMFWFAKDSEQVAARGVRVVASEQRFGLDGDVTIALADGRRLAVYGSVDRIDRTATGLVVTDHKVGSTKAYSKIERADPTSGGTRFQLPAYAAAAGVIAAGPDRLPGLEPVRAEYSFFHKGDYQRIGYDFDADVWTQVAADLQHVVSGVEAGWFPATAIKPQYQFRIDCQYCEPDSLGTAERYSEWERKRHDPRLAPWFPPDDEGEA
jgi:ATP-dependent helicase/nuclease subunit B